MSYILTALDGGDVADVPAPALVDLSAAFDHCVVSVTRLASVMRHWTGYSRT